MTIQHFNDPLAHCYLDGTRFYENITFKYDFEVPVRSRIELLLQIAEGKHILHVGCCDHIRLLPQKIATRTWLQGRLTEVAARCIGIDSDPEAVDQARALSRLDNIFCEDITDGRKILAISENIFDYALFGEVIEHVGNPTQFVGSFLSNYKMNVRQVIITAPNAFRAGNLRNIFKVINSDHRFFFTPYTLAKVAWDAGLTPVSIRMAHYSEAGPLKRAILDRFPLLAEDLVYIGAPR